MCIGVSNSEQSLSKEGYALVGAVFEVHKEQGGGLLEEIYPQSLGCELELRGIPFRAKEPLCVFCKEQKLNKRYIPDLLVYNQILVQLKTVRELAPEHEA